MGSVSLGFCSEEAVSEANVVADARLGTDYVWDMSNTGEFSITYPMPSTGDGVTFIPLGPAPSPRVCPCCGRCRECGQPAPIVPTPYPSTNPWPQYVEPIWLVDLNSVARYVG
jgi:hypothetical protein